MRRRPLSSCFPHSWSLTMGFSRSHATCVPRPPVCSPRRSLQSLLWLGGPLLTTPWGERGAVQPCTLPFPPSSLHSHPLCAVSFRRRVCTCAQIVPPRQVFTPPIPCPASSLSMLLPLIPSHLPSLRSEETLCWGLTLGLPHRPHSNPVLQSSASFSPISI